MKKANNTINDEIVTDKTEKPKSKVNVKRIIRDAMFLAILIICSFISINVGASPITLQVFAVYLIIALIPIIDSVLIIFTYILMGTIGLPVFSGGSVGSFASPTYGFIIGFILSALFCYLFELIFHKFISKTNCYITLIIKALIFILVIYLCGIPYFSYITSNTILASIIYFLPFMGIDICKIALVLVIYKRLNMLIKEMD